MMKYGIRKPSIKRSFKAKTTGYAKRTLKSISPSYNIKGFGIFKAPKKTIYNRLYNKTTISLFNDKHIDNNDKSNLIKNNHINIFNKMFYYIKNILISFKNIKNKKHLIDKNQKTNYFNIKARCFICDKDLSLKTLKGRYQLIDGWLCMKCFKNVFNKQRPLLFNIYTKEDIKLILSENIRE